MKAIVIMTAGVIAFSPACAQKLSETNVPATVKESFSKKYPGTKAKWEKEGTDFEAEFDLNKTESSAVFDGNGVFKELEQEIKTSELPKSISDYCTKSFTGYKLSEASKITDVSGKITFEAEMSKGKEHFDAMFDKTGNFIKKSDLSKGEEDKD